MSAERFLRLPAVQEKTGLKRDTIYRKVKSGEFPKPIRIAARASAWLESEVDQFISDRIAVRSTQAPIQLPVTRKLVNLPPESLLQRAIDHADELAVELRALRDLWIK